MITMSEVYWITRLDYIQGLFLNLGVFGIIAFTITLWRGFYMDYENVKKIGAFGLLTSIIFSVLHCLTPATKEMCAILIIPKIVNSEHIQTMGKDIIDLEKMAVEYLKSKTEVKP